MLLPILQDDEPILRKRAVRVTEFNTPFLHDLVNNMFETMRHANGIGLADPQVGVGLALFIFGGVENIPATVLINPKVEAIGNELVQMGEGCLSLPGCVASITRPAKVYYSGWDPMHRFIEGEATGLHARVILHENDHLKGILLLDRIEDEKDIAKGL